jgi:hypothetical protein
LPGGDAVADIHDLRQGVEQKNNPVKFWREGKKEHATISTGRLGFFK